MYIIYILTLPIIIYFLSIILYLKTNPPKLKMECLAFDQLDQKAK